MDWQTKLDALNNLEECRLIMRKPGDWYVYQMTETGGDGLLHGVYGNGITPEAAVLDHWSLLVDDLPAAMHVRTSNDKRWKWSGYMWREVPNA